jgi:hypothetical protein
MRKDRKIKYNEKIMIGKTPKDQMAIEDALLRGRKLHIDIVDSELRVLDLWCFIATDIYKEH